MNGYTLMHEHITIDLSGVKKDTDCQLDCFEETLKEFQNLYKLGVRTVVDVTNDGMGRNTAYVSEIENRMMRNYKVCAFFFCLFNNIICYIKGYQDFRNSIFSATNKNT